MKHEIACLNTDAPNRYNMVFTPSALEQALRQRWRTGTPSHLAHDSTRLAGWMVPVSLFFEPQLTRLIGVFQTPENPEEEDKFSGARVAFLMDSHEERCRPYVEDLRGRLRGRVSDRAELIDAGCATFFDKGIAERVFSSILSNADKDGLVNVKDLKHLGGGMFEVEGLVLFAHSYFRRSFSLINNINTHFFHTLGEVKDQGLDVWIAIDPDLVGLPESYQPAIELEYWWGPKFSEDLSSIEPGVAKHQASEFQRLYTGVSTTEFWWQSRKGEHILEVEELRDSPQPGTDVQYGCRYLHCVVDESSKQVRHIDGAVRSYSEEEMIVRLDKDIKKADRTTDYVKLWRVDSDIDIGLWKRLVSDFFRDNHLVGEYLDAEDKAEFRPTTRKDDAVSFSPLQKYTGFGINPGSGSRINLSYHESYNETKSGSEVVPLDTLTIEDKTFTVIDLWTIELKKILIAAGRSLTIPSGVSYVACEDLYINLPLVAHGSMEDAKETLDAVRNLLQWSEGRSHDRAVSINISYPLSDTHHDIRVSIYGHCTDLLKFFGSEVSELPETVEAASLWCNRLADWLKQYSTSDRPVPGDIIQPSGVIWLKRQQVPADVDVKYEYDKKAKRVKWKAKFPAKYAELAKSLQSQTLEIRCCHVVENVECTLCGKDFLLCNCSVVLDNAGKKITKCEPIGGFLTDKPA